MSWIQKGDRARDAQDWPQARAHYEKALQLNPNIAPIWIQLGHAAKESGDPGAAEAAYRQALQIKPDDADGHLQLGHLMKVGGRLSAAMSFYSRALALDPQLTAAHKEIEALRKRMVGDAPAAGEAGFVPGPAIRKTVPPGTASAVFEVSDLLAYFRGSRLPTGIQRVQMEVIKAASESSTRELDYAIVCFVQERGFWIEVPQSLFDSFCQASVAGSDVSAPEWVALLAALDRVLSGNPLFQFPANAILLDLGTSWWQRNYFLNLRLAKIASGIRYVPFIHDLIPVMTPEYCAADLRRDFVSWIIGVFRHADYFFANSNSTKKDLNSVAAELGYALPETAVVPLAADFRHSVGAAESFAAEDRKLFLESHGLAPGGYVLCVATIEVRKNHAAAFAVWLRLLKKYGVRNVPKLVCVGKAGWLNDNVYDMLHASEILRHHVVMLQNVSDAALATLYENCLCTIYPSFYEGWGLPVTEALCYGKVPVVANVSSLPEAGGAFAEYFEIGSENEFLSKVERLIRDPAYRAEKERKIAAEFRPTTWNEISASIISKLKQWWKISQESGNIPAGTAPAKAATGVLHSMARGADTILWKGLESGEIYRHGQAWWPSEDWGCWTKGVQPATLAFTLSDVENSELLIYMAVRGAPVRDSSCTLRTEGARSLEVELAPEQDQVLVLELEAASEQQRQITVSISTSTVANLSELSDGADNRILGPGIRWFYVCRKDDLLARVSMAEALAIGDFHRLMRRSPPQPDFFLHT